jgi:hypothetical protein
MGSLEELAREKFGELSAAEKKVVQAAPHGTVADCSLGGDVEPEKADTWLAARDVRADLIRWLCVDREARELVDPRGVQILGARITGELDLSFANVLFPLFLKGCRLEQRIDLRSAKMPVLSLEGSWTGAIAADELKLEGTLFLKSAFHAEGEVRLLGATIGGNLNAMGGTFKNLKSDKNPDSTGYTLTADGIKVTGGVFMRNELDADVVKNKFVAEGEVRLLGATIGGNLDADGGTFRNPNPKGYALNADRIKVHGGVSLRNIFVPEGGVRLHGAEVTGQLQVADAWLGAFDLDSAHVTGPFVWRNIHKDRHPDFPDTEWKPSLNLTDATVGPLADQPSSWPEKEELRLDGFVYDRIAAVPDAKVLIDAKARLDWLHRQPDELGYLPQPYEQLIAVMRQMGYEDQVAEVGIAKKKDLHQRGGLGRWGKFWSWFLYLVVGYGYKPWWAFGWLALLVLIGTCMFSRAHAANVLVPSDKEAYQSNRTTAENTLPQFHALVYSLDIVLPFGLGQKAHFRLSEKPSGDFVYWIFELYSLFQLFAGWALWLVAGAVPTGLIKKD